MKKYNKAGVILLIALCFLCLKTQCTEIQPEQPENDQRNNYHKRKRSPHFIHILKRYAFDIQIKPNQ